MTTISHSLTMYRLEVEIILLKMREILGSHVTPTVQQPNARCVWGLGPRTRSRGSCVAKNHAENVLKVVPWFVAPMCWKIPPDLAVGLIVLGCYGPRCMESGPGCVAVVPGGPK